MWSVVAGGQWSQVVSGRMWSVVAGGRSGRGGRIEFTSLEATFTFASLPLLFLSRPFPILLIVIFYLKFYLSHNINKHVWRGRTVFAPTCSFRFY